MSLPIHCLVVRPRRADDPRARSLLADAHALGLTGISTLQVRDLYFVEGPLSAEAQIRLETELLSDPVTQTAEWRSRGRPLKTPPNANQHRHILEVALRPGVTDPVAEQIVRAAAELGVHSVTRAATGRRYAVFGPALAEADLHRLARSLLANPVIQHYALGEIEPSFPEPAQPVDRTDIIPLCGQDDDGLLAVSRQRRAALDLAEMRAVQAYFRAVGRDPTDVEFETIAQTWSEHCVHKTFKARIEIVDQRLETEPPVSSHRSPALIDGLLHTYIRAATEQINAPWVRSAFVDNAGVIDFDDEYEIAFKVETHNHPSAIEPFGGANTGVGGVIRDILGVSAKPIAATDVLCFGPQDLDPAALPEGVLHPRRIQSGVVAGIEDYGNKIGLPTVNGAVVYDPGYTSNPLVFCGCVGIAPKGRHPREPRPGDRVLVLGGRTGRDGLRGATFSSMTMDAQTGEVAGASVQIGDPITEKGLIEVITRARDLDLYHAITDCGAGGLSSAVGEMARATGADVELTRVRLKYPGLAPWEIWLSEAQERMALAAPAEAVAALQALCATYQVELTDIGAFTETGRLVVRYDGRVVLDLANEFLHDGIPQRQLTAVVEGRRKKEGELILPCRLPPSSSDHNQALLQLLGHPNIASKAAIIHVYDHEVQGGTVVKPLTGAQNDGPSDACVLKPLGTRGLRGIVLANGLNPELGKHDPYQMAWSAVDEAVRNAVAVGADPDRIALLDNFCWGDPARPETLGALAEAARGCHDAARHYRTPFISGKDSLNNEYLGSDGQRHAIPGTLLISAIGLIDDVTRAVTMDLKEAGNLVYLLGESPVISDQWPQPAPALYRALHAAIHAGLVRACHDLSEGGLAVAAAEMCIGGRLGLALTIEADDPAAALFGESDGRLLAEVRPQDTAAFETRFAGLPARRIGLVTGGPRLNLSTHDRSLISLSVQTLVDAWMPSAS